MKRQIERNVQIYLDRRNGMTFRAIADKHGISSDRARQICLREAWELKRLAQKTELEQLVQNLEALKLIAEN